MSPDKANAGDFSRHLHSLRELAKTNAFSSPLEITEVASPLQTYFRLYGFDTLTADNSQTSYSIGTLQYHQLNVVAHWWRHTSNSAANSVDENSADKNPLNKNPLHKNATICVVHGLFDHVGLYLKVIHSLLQQGYDVFALDMPGHGLSEGASAEIGNFSEYVDVLELAFDKIYAEDVNTKLYLLGQSTGAAGIAHYLLTGKRKTQIKGAVFLAPLLRPVNWWYVNGTWMLLHRFLDSVPRRFAANSNDQEFLEFLANRDPLQPQAISVRWVSALRKWVKRFSTLPKSDTRVLMLQGDEDGTVDWRYNLPRYQKQFPNNQTKMLPGAKHHLVNESAEHMEKLQAEITDFLKSLQKN